jgi:hypothetical protein
MSPSERRPKQQLVSAVDGGYETLGSRVGKLTNQPDGRDLVADHLIDALHDDVIDAGVPTKADFQFGLNDRNVPDT